MSKIDTAPTANSIASQTLEIELFGNFPMNVQRSEIVASKILKRINAWAESVDVYYRYHFYYEKYLDLI